MGDTTPWIVAEDRGGVRKHAPATSRNRDAIAAVLAKMLPGAGLVLEIASGSGEHAAHFAQAFPRLTWQPSDPDESGRASIAAWCKGLGNVRSPIMIDVEDDEWPVAHADAILCINMIHISPWEATIGLMRGAGLILPSGAPLYLYGPFCEANVPLAPGNTAFDASLKDRDPRWGLRDVADVATAAASNGLDLIDRIEMPANNLSLIFRRR